MKKYVFLVAACVMTVFAMVFVSCATTTTATTSSSSPTQSESSGTAIQSGSTEDPFVGTSWSSKGITLLEFTNDGKVEYGYTKLSYKVTQDGNGYVASFRGAGISMSFTIESPTATDGVFIARRKKMPCKKIN